MLRRLAAAAVLMSGAVASGAHAADGPGVGNADTCDGAALTVTVCAEDNNTAPGSGGGHSAVGASNTARSDESKCTYTRLNPQPPPDNYYWKGHQGEKGAVYGMTCSDRQGAFTLFIPEGQAPAAPQINPTVLAQRAVNSMKLTGPKVSSPRVGGAYVVGMPMWMWVEPTPTTYGPNTATATAGGVTVSATAKVTRIRWNMGDGSAPTVCTGPGTRYTANAGKSASPDCGHIYTTTSQNADGQFRGTATATWIVDWQVVGGTGATGQLTEIRETPFTVEVREVQVLN